MFPVALQHKTIDKEVRKYITELETRNLALKNNVVEYQNKYLAIKEQYDLLVYKKFCRSSEQLIADDIQPLLFTQEAETVEAAEEESETEELSEVKAHSRKKVGRKPLDPNLQRREVIIDIPQSEKICACGAEMARIGEETNEKLHIIPMQIFVEKTVRPKYACRSCEGVEDDAKPAVRIAPVPKSIIPKGIVSPSLLSTVITYKFERHLPYYRQEQIYGQIGADISRQDMSNWQRQAYEKLTPLFDLLKETVKSGTVIQMDETTVQVIGEENRADTQKSYMWLARGGPDDKKVIWYEYHPTRAAYHAKEFLGGYCGYLQTDGYIGYDKAVKDMPDIIHVGCFAHARRKFFEAGKINKQSLSAQEGIKYIRKLYDIEDALRRCFEKDKDSENFVRKRKAETEPVLKQFKAWLDKRNDEVLPTSLLGKAIYYSLSHWGKMTAYLESPHLTPDNNACENSIRPFVLGRKNWLFCQSQGGAESSCGMYTLIETAKQNGLVAFDYLMALFEKAPLAKTADDWKKLLPWHIFTA